MVPFTRQLLAAGETILATSDDGSIESLASKWGIEKRIVQEAWWPARMRPEQRSVFGVVRAKDGDATARSTTNRIRRPSRRRTDRSPHPGTPAPPPAPTERRFASVRPVPSESVRENATSQGSPRSRTVTVGRGDITKKGAG